MTQTKMTTIKQPPRTWEQTHALAVRKARPELDRRGSKPTRAEQRAMHRPPPPPPTAQTANPAPPPTELELLRAKATVCDRYMRWLDTSDRDDRLQLAAALDHTRRLELRLKGGW